MSASKAESAVTIQVESVDGFQKGDLIEKSTKALIVAVGDKSMTVLFPSGYQQTLLLSEQTKAQPGMYAESKMVATVLGVDSSTNELHITPWELPK